VPPFASIAASASRPQSVVGGRSAAWRVGGRDRATDARTGHRLAPITDDEQLVGMITDRDITTRVVAEAADPKMTSVGAV
jgi:CBS domain-containing protein